MDSIYYTVYVDNNVIGGERVFGIEENGFEVVTFTFTAGEKEGDYIFKVKLDELGDIIESDISNNEIEQEFEIKAAGSFGSLRSLASILIVVILLVGGAVYYRYSRISKMDQDPRLSIRKKPVISETSIKFPIILNCLQCSSRVRVARPGSFRCPSCKSVSDVDANGEMEITEKSKDLDEEVAEKTTAAILREEKSKPSSSKKLSRMEQFLSGNEEEEVVEESKDSELSASEKLKLLKEESETEVNRQEVDDGEEVADEEPSDEEKPKRSKKRKGPPKGGSFGPTVGGF